MTKKDQPAFPHSGKEYIYGEVPSQDRWQKFQKPGLTLRQYYAAKAMQAFLHPDHIEAAWRGTHDDVEPAIAYAAFKMADAMIAKESKDEQTK